MVSGPLPATMASPSLARFLAAFTSRSRTRPHIAQTYLRSDRSSLAFTAPDPEQVLLEGNHRSTTTTAHRSMPSCTPAAGGSAQTTHPRHACQAVVSEHPGNEQVLNNDGPVLPGQGGDELVDGVFALVGDPARSLTQCSGRVAPPVRGWAALLGGRVVGAHSFKYTITIYR